MPRGVYSGFTCKEKHGKFTPQAHQLFVKDYFLKSPFKGLLLYHRLGSGKCFGKDTPIIMFDGSIKKVQDIVVGNKVMGDDSTPRLVLNLSTGIDDMYKVTPVTGDSYTVNSQHVLSLKYCGNSKPHGDGPYCVSYFNKEHLALHEKSFPTFEKAELFFASQMYIDISVKNYLSLSNNTKALLKGYRVAVNFAKKKVQFNPYILGIWLGDDSQRNPVITNETIKYYRLVNNKHVPDDYKYNSKTVRLQILAGILDSDGYNGLVNTYDILSENKRLATDIVYLCRSLGFTAYIKQCEESCIYYRISISGDGLGEIPVKIKRNGGQEDALVTGITVVKQNRESYHGFEVDGNHRFLLGDFTVTHNSCSGILTADEMLRLKKIKTVYVISPGGLRQGWLKEYCDVCGSKHKQLTDNYVFITYNYNVAKELPENFNDSLVIIDEIHNFINGVKNQAKNAEAVYARLAISDCRILALSGTPIFNNIFEWSLLGNLLKPNSMHPIIIDGHLNTKDFMNMFNIADDGYLTAKDPEAFKKSAEGIISYFPGLGGGLYPTVIEEEIIKVPMTLEQEIQYWPKFKTEEIFIKTPLDPYLRFTNPKKYAYLKQMKIIAKKRIMSRQSSNFIYPKEIVGEAVEEIDEEGTPHTVKPKDAVVPKGWVERKYFSDGQLKKQYSTKMATLFDNILNNFRSKHMVFTFFKEHSGVNIMKAIFEMCGLRTEVFSGNLSDAGRTKLLREFNSPKNRYGGDIKVIFVTDAGAEGITLLETGHVHILESDPRENKIQQAIGRAVRFKSHIKMPKDEQVVHIWRYWSISGADPTIKEVTDVDGKITMVPKDPSQYGVAKTIDELLYEQGQQKMNTLNSFLQLLIDTSIENVGHPAP